MKISERNHDNAYPVAKQNRRRSKEASRRRMKEDGRSTKLIQRIIQGKAERAESGTIPTTSKKRRVRRGT